MNTFVNYVMDDGETTQEQKVSTLQTIKDWIDHLIQSIRNFISGHTNKQLGYEYAESLGLTSQELESISRMLTGVLDTARENLEARTEISGQKNSEEAEAHSVEVQVREEFLSDKDINDYIRGGGRFHKNRAEAYKNGERIIIRNKSELSNKINDILAGELKDVTKQIPFAVSKVGDSISEDIDKMSYGSIKTKGYFFQVQPNDLRHSYNEHHIAKESGDLDMSKKDMINALSRINEGKVELIEKVKGGGNKIIISLDMGNGKVLSVFVVSKNDGTLSFKNMWVMTENGFKNYIDKIKGVDTAEGLSPGTAHSRTSFKDNIPNPLEKIKTQDISEKKAFSLNVPVEETKDLIAVHNYKPAENVKNHDYSYETLINKEPITIYSVNKLNLNKTENVQNVKGAELVSDTRKNIKIYNEQKKNGLGDSDLYNRDIGNIVRISRKGITHKKGGENKAHIEAITQIPAYFENAIVLNEAGGQRDNADMAYLVYGVYDDGPDRYITRSIVDHYDDGHSIVEGIDEILYSTTKKKNQTPQEGTSVLSRQSDSSSKMSISELLETVKKHFPDDLSEDVAKRYYSRKNSSRNKQDKFLLCYNHRYSVVSLGW